MYIVTKLNIITNTVDIIRVVDDGHENDNLIGYDALLKDALEVADGSSVKNISDKRLEIYSKGIFGQYLAFVYQLHEICEVEE